MNYVKPSALLQKTIKEINSNAVNSWLIVFTDGTKVVLDTEPGPARIPSLVLYTPSSTDASNFPK